ncbi:hypothetical protein FA13DRAFT_1796085 [Coprinellus micaceus]|uniref:Uncharacterized protein n=1 Tax=Coprinellus micaceus TaxID=71717 RepID=A0A4Y7SVV4_COPMI|nr:hypothetical protein FA13DRAFT_1796085 [Coprinellus micaceus]
MCTLNANCGKARSCLDTAPITSGGEPLSSPAPLRIQEGMGCFGRVLELPRGGNGWIGSATDGTVKDTGQRPDTPPTSSLRPVHHLPSSHLSLCHLTIPPCRHLPALGATPPSGDRSQPAPLRANSAAGTCPVHPGRTLQEKQHPRGPSIFNIGTDLPRPFLPTVAATAPPLPDPLPSAVHRQRRDSATPTHRHPPSGAIDENAAARNVTLGTGAPSRRNLAHHTPPQPQQQQQQQQRHLPHPLPFPRQPRRQHLNESAGTEAGVLLRGDAASSSTATTTPTFIFSSQPLRNNPHPHLQHRAK